MKKLITLVLALVALGTIHLEAQRYLTEVFADVTVTTGIKYARNVTVLSGAPVPTDLTFDLYSPTGDAETNRPLVILFHTGNFLPQGLNGGVSGTKTDLPDVETATRLAKMGYVVAVADYRLGWNPLSDDINVRISTLINAAYRGIQDARSCVRFFRKDAIDGSNQYGICPDKVTYWGFGTGGYIATAAAAIDSYSEIVLPKFIDTNTGNPFVILPVHGDPFGTAVGLNPATGDTLSMINTPGYDYKVQLAVNLGGAIGDTSWIDASDGAFISFQVPDDPFAPYKEDILVVPTTGDLIVEVQGSYLIQKKASDLGLNASFTGITDVYTTAADANNDGFNGLFPFIRPMWANPFDPSKMESESSPWDWWNSAFWQTQPHPSCPAGLPLSVCNFDVIARINNPDASETKGKTYLDSVFGYFAPRAYAHLNLAADYCAPLAVEEVLSANQVNLKVSPNPSNGLMVFTSDSENPMETVGIYNLAGQLMKFHVVKNNYFLFDRESLQTGMYIARVKFADGIVTEKVIFD